MSRPLSRAIPAAALIAAAGFALLYGDYRAEVTNHREVMLARGQTVLDALAAGIRAQGRMGRYRPERLSAIFEELLQTPEITGLELRAENGSVISSAGEAPPLPAIRPGAPQWTSDHLVIAGQPVLLGSGHGLGPGPGRGWGRAAQADGWEAFPSGPYLLTATLDTSAMLEEIRGDRLRLGLFSGVMLIAVASGVAALLSRSRRRALDAALQASQERIAHQEHLTHLGAGLAHETKNPLGIVRGLAQLISHSSQSPEAHAENRTRALQMLDEIDRTIGQINSFLALARPKNPDVGPVHLATFFEGLMPLVRSEAQQRHLTLGFHDAGLTIAADVELLRRALLNLVLNAFRACQPNDEIRISAQKMGHTVRLTVSDTGCGIAPEDLGLVTEPYFTRFEGGSGLGLSLVKQIAQAHGWQLCIASDLGQGSQISLEGIQELKADVR